MKRIGWLILILGLNGCAAEVGKNKNDENVALASDNARLKEQNKTISQDLKACEGWVGRRGGGQ